MNLAEVTGDKTHRLLNRSTATEKICVAVFTQMAVFFSKKYKNYLLRR